MKHALNPAVAEFFAARVPAPPKGARAPQPSAAPAPDEDWLNRMVVVGEIRTFLDATRAHDAIANDNGAWLRARDRVRRGEPRQAAATKHASATPVPEMAPPESDQALPQEIGTVEDCDQLIFLWRPAWYGPWLRPSHER